MSEDKKIGWTISELPGIALINPIILLPEEERKKKIAIIEEARVKLATEGEEPKEGEKFVCPNGCEGEFRTHGTMGTAVGYFGADGNHYTQECSCRTCGTRFTKEWVPADNGGKPWYIVGATWEERKVYSGECQCCCPEETE